MRSLILSAIALAVSLPALTEPSDIMGVTVSGLTRRTVFLASPAMGDAVTMPVLRICYDAAATGAPLPETLSVHLGEAVEPLGPDECGLFAGERVELAVWKGDGTIRASVTLLR